MAQNMTNELKKTLADIRAFSERTKAQNLRLQTIVENRRKIRKDMEDLIKVADNLIAQQNEVIADLESHPVIVKQKLTQRQDDEFLRSMNIVP